MENRYQWTPELSTGHGAIDNQHQELFDLVSMLDQAMYSNNRADLEKIIVFLEHYVEEHFAEEEELMQSHHYNGYAHHKEDHEIFKARVFSIRHDFDAELPHTRLVFTLRLFIDKLVHHIHTIDIGIAEIPKKKS